MKKVRKSKTFKKCYEKRIHPYPKLVKRVTQRIELFEKDRRNSLLNDHMLKGNLTGLRSFSITGDIRIVYREYEDLIVFVFIGSHNQVYR